MIRGTVASIPFVLFLACVFGVVRLLPSWGVRVCVYYMGCNMCVGGVGLLMTRIIVRACFVCEVLFGGVACREWLMCPRIIGTCGRYVWPREMEM